jgi:aminopeptidase N
MVPVMWDDAFPSSHPVEANVETPDQINNVFDSITYAKGHSVLRQLENVVGEKAFRDGLKDYIIKNQYGSGVAAEFYNSLLLVTYLFL